MPDTLHIEDLDSFLFDVVDLLEHPEAQEPLQEWTEEAKHELGELMRQEISPDGVPHAPLAESTIRRKGHGRILQDTGDLMESVEGEGDGHIEVVESDSVLLGTDHRKDGVPVAQYLHHGTSRMPARPFVGVTENMADRAVELIGEELLIQIDAL